MFLFPRLRTVDARPLLDAVVTASLTELQQDQDLLPRGVVWAPTGGVRVDEPWLRAMREDIRRVAIENGFTVEGSTSTRVAEGGALDRALARLLFTRMKLSANEAACGDVWRYFACVVAPEVVRWRFPGKDGSPEQRFGSSLKRNLYARLWWRAFTFREPEADNSWELLDALGEDEMVQIMERPNAAGYRALARGLARGLLRNHRAAPTTNRSQLLRDAMKRLLRRMPLLRYETLGPDEMDASLDELFADSLAAAGVVRAQLTLPLSPVPAPTPRRNRGRPWASLALGRRYAFVSALTAAEVEAILHTFPVYDPHESEPRWALVRGLEAEHLRLIEVLPHSASVAQRMGVENLGAWLGEGSHGSWVRDVPPDRAWTLLRLIDTSWLRAWRLRLDWGAAPTDDGELLRELMRRFDGDWQEVVGWMDRDSCAEILGLVLPELDAPEDARSQLAGWLVGRPVTVTGLGRLPSLPAPDSWLDDDTTEEALRPQASDVPGASGAEQDWTVLLKDERPIPEAPGLIRNLLIQLNVQTRADLARVDLEGARSIPGIGRRKVALLEDWRVKVLGASPPSVGELDLPTLPTALLESPIGPVPSLLRGLLAELDVTTVGELLALDPSSLKTVGRVGPQRIAELRSFQAAARTRTVESPVPREPFADLATLRALARASVQGREHDILTRRLLHGASLLECAQPHGLSRERARQILVRVLARMREEYGDEARRLLRAEVALASTEGRVIHRGMASSATIPFEELRLPLELVEEGWSLVEGDWFVRGGASELDALVQRVDEWRAGRTALDEKAFDDAPGVRPLIELVLRERLEMHEQEDGSWVLDPSSMTPAVYLEEKMAAAGAAVHQTEIGRWLLERDGAEVTEENLDRAVRRAAGMLDRRPAAFRIGHGTFIHRDALPIAEARLFELAGWCVDRMRNASHAFSTRALLEQLHDEAPEEAQAFTPWLLKDVLKRRPDVKVLPKFLVGHAETFNEEGVQLADRLETILKTAGVPLSLDEVLDRLPEGLTYSPVSAYSALSQGGFATRAGRGRFILAPEEE